MLHLRLAKSEASIESEGKFLSLSACCYKHLNDKKKKRYSCFLDDSDLEATFNVDRLRFTHQSKAKMKTFFP